MMKPPLIFFFMYILFPTATSAHSHDYRHQFNHAAVSVPLHCGEVAEKLLVEALKDMAVGFEPRGARVPNNELSDQSIHK